MRPRTTLPLLVLFAAACARQGAPPGGPQDRRPPLVIGTEPAPFDTVEAVKGPVVIHFNERISEKPSRGTLNGAVVVSPQTGDVRVSHARDALDVEISGGFKPNLVYRVTLLPVIQDMFSNTMQAPFEFVFSTGAPFQPNVVAGTVVDRITGKPVEGYEVRAVPSARGADTTVVNVARTDTAGFFALRYLPEGQYELTAFEDLNGNGRMDFPEARASRGVLVRQADTVIVEVPVLKPDTTRAVLGRVEALDSTTLRLTFDDYIAPDQPLNGVGVGLALDTVAPEGSPPPPPVVRILHPEEYQAYMDSVGAATRIPAPGANPQPAAGERRIPRPGEVPTTPGQQRGAVEGGPLPSQQLYAILGAPLPANVPYQVTATGIVNVNGIPLGGGKAVVVRQPPPAAKPAPGARPDTTGAAPDSAGAAPDSAGAAPRDTLTVASAAGAP